MIGKDFCSAHSPDRKDIIRKNCQIAREINLSQHGDKLLARRGTIDISKLSTVRDVDNALKDLAIALLANKVDHNTARVANSILTQLHKSFSEKREEMGDASGLTDEEMVKATVDQFEDMGLIEALRKELDVRPRG